MTASNLGGNDAAFGVCCSYLNSEGFYFLGFDDDGYYGIARIESLDFIVLTGEESATVRLDAMALFQPALKLKADCYADGTLCLIVDGVVIAGAQDADPYGPVGSASLCRASKMSQLQ